MLEFLELSPSPLPEDWNPRSRKGFKIGWLQRFLKRPPFARSLLAGEQFRKRIVARPAKKPSPLGQAIMNTRKKLLEWNRAPPPRVEMRPSFVQEIRDALQDDVTTLSHLLGRDLGHWLRDKDENRSLDKAA